MSVFHEEKAFLKTDLAFAIWDKHPLAPGHFLVCPVREVKDFFKLGTQEVEEIYYLLETGYRAVEAMEKPDGYRIMINNGYGQHIPHVHVHLIPTYKDRRIPAYDEP